VRFSGRFLLTTTFRRRRISLYIALSTVAIPANYTSKFWELFEATAYIPSVSTCACIYVCTYRLYLYAGLHVVKNEACETDIKSTDIVDLTPCVLVEFYRPSEENTALIFQVPQITPLMWLVISSLITF
jgi:hypothetical protein